MTLVFSESEDDNHAYSCDLVPRCFVHTSITEEILDTIEKKQHERCDLFNRVNNIDTLMKLCRRVAKPEQLRLFDELQETYTRLATDKASQPGKMEKMLKEGQRTIARSIIRKEYAKIQYGTLDKDECLTVRWFDFNPRLTIVFDDCTAELPRISKWPSFVNIVTRGRHIFCTLIMALHGEVVTPLIRSNMRISIFTDPNTARVSGTRATNGADRTTRDEIERYASRICVDAPPYTKLCIIDSQMFLFSASIHPSFSAVSDQIRVFSESIAKKEDTKSSTLDLQIAKLI